MTRLGLAKTRHRRLFAFELRRWGYAARERWSIVAMARIAAIFCRSRDDPAAANPAKPLLTLRSQPVWSPPANIRMPLKTPRHRGISQIWLGLRVRDLATEAPFRPPVSEATF